MAEVIKHVADPLLVVYALGIAVTKTALHEVRAACPIHGGENPTSLRVNLDTGNWLCFSSGCHEGNSDIIGLVMKVKQINFKDALIFLADLFNIDLNGNISSLARKAVQEKEIAQFTRRMKKNELEMDSGTIYSIEDCVSWITKERSNFFIDMGYSPELLDYLEVGGEWVDRFGVHREAIRLRDAKGKLIAIDGRRKDGDDNPRYRVQPEGCRKRTVLYHYNHAKDWVPIFNGTLFIVEGYKACWSMIQYGWSNTVACMGSRLSDEQPEILIGDLNLRRIIFLLDGDEAGLNGSRSSARILQRFFDVSIIDLPEGKDPSNLEQQFLSNAIEQAL